MSEGWGSGKRGYRVERWWRTVVVRRSERTTDAGTRTKASYRPDSSAIECLKVDLPGPVYRAALPVQMELPAAWGLFPSPRGTENTLGRDYWNCSTTWKHRGLLA
ncbi:uncharacterized protein LOC143146154 [Ptiloglossa arizonensis]|uniref:uncharacterized protein LOC143146154 n=1 Tax=Ptiloglossa arizonensis TaxID=3350558 RepID=UPI003FA0D724